MIDCEEDIIGGEFNFPQLPPEKFHQIYEVTSGVHPLHKAKGVNSQKRRSEVENLEKPNNYEDYCLLMGEGVHDPKIEVLRLDEPTAMYLNLVSQGVLPP